MLTVGDKIYRTPRDTRYDKSTFDIIESETARSWVIVGGLKIPKKPQNSKEAVGNYRSVKVSNCGHTHNDFYLSEAAYKDAIWKYANRYKIGRAICDDYELSIDVLRQIAALIGYKEDT